METLSWSTERHDKRLRTLDNELCGHIEELHNKVGNARAGEEATLEATEGHCWLLSEELAQSEMELDERRDACRCRGSDKEAVVRDEGHSQGLLESVEYSLAEAQHTYYRDLELMKHARIRLIHENEWLVNNLKSLHDTEISEMQLTLSQSLGSFSITALEAS